MIEESTVKTHVKRILMKLGLRDRIQTVIFAYESGLTRPGRNQPTDWTAAVVGDAVLAKWGARRRAGAMRRWVGMMAGRVGRTPAWGQGIRSDAGADAQR